MQQSQECTQKQKKTTYEDGEILMSVDVCWPSRNASGDTLNTRTHVEQVSNPPFLMCG